VRYSILIAVILLSGTVARAQETEARIQKILHPDTNSTSHLTEKSYYGGKSFQQTGPAYTKNFYYTEHYSPKEFTTRSYYGATPYSTGKFATHAANTKGEYEIPNAAKKADTKTAETKESSDSRKGYSTRDYSTREYRDRGKSQEILDLQKKDLKPMSIDQVREMLNKNK
jgi:hypothetical protein